MNQSILVRFASLVLLCCSFQAVADADDTLSEVRTNIEKSIPGLTITSLAETPVPGLFELVMDGQIYYVSKGGDYLLDGNLIELGTRTNLTEDRIGGIHMGLIEGLGEENMLIYEPDEPSDRSITVFTDLSCPYCQKLHEEIDVLLDAGVRVRYLMFPRAGIGSQAHADLESVWCAEDPQKAMTIAKSGGKVESSSCDNPIESHVALAEQVGLRGTPLIYLDDGQRISGYREATILADMINTSEKLKLSN